MKKFGIIAFLLMMAVTAFAANTGIDLPGVSENERLTKAVIFAGIAAFWVGALWAHVLTSHATEEKYSRAFIRDNDELPRDSTEAT